MPAPRRQPRAGAHALYPLPDILEKLFVDPEMHWRLQEIWMRIQDGHPTPVDDEIELVHPHPGRSLAKDDKQRVILRQRVGELDEPTTKEGPDTHGSARHDLVR